MKKCILAAMLAGVINTCWAIRSVETVDVPTLSGTVQIPRNELHRLKPINWAMMLDGLPTEAHRKKNRLLYDEACRNDPELKSEVEKLQNIHGMIQSRKGWGMTRFMPPRRRTIIITAR